MSEMRPMRLDPETANRLAGGTLSPDDAPPGYAGVAQLLAEAKTGGLAASSTRESATVTAMQAALLGHLVPSSPNQRKRMLTKLLTVKGAIVAGTVLLGAGTAGAVTGSLPSGVQNSVHNALATLDISVPNGHANGHANGHSSGHHGNNSNAPSSNSSSVSTNSNALPGLCNAASHNGTTGTSGADTNKPNVHSVFGPGANKINSTTCTGVAAPGSSAGAGTGATPGSEGSTNESPTGSGASSAQGDNASSTGTGASSAQGGNASSTGTGTTSAQGGNASSTGSTASQTGTTGH